MTLCIVRILLETNIKEINTCCVIFQKMFPLFEQLQYIAYSQPSCLELACLDILDKSNIFVSPCKIAVDLVYFYL